MDGPPQAAKAHLDEEDRRIATTVPGLLHDHLGDMVATTTPTGHSHLVECWSTLDHPVICNIISLFNLQ